MTGWRARRLRAVRGARVLWGELQYRRSRAPDTRPALNPRKAALPLLHSLGLALVISLAGWLLRALAWSGAVAASLVGTLILWRSGWAGMAVLGTFFVGASAISRLAPDRAALAGETRGNTRDHWQVLANGGAAALGAVLVSVPAALWVVTASLAAAAADTWATATGGWSRTAPRLVLGGQRVPAGTSGGVTWAGTAGALVGAATTAVAGASVSGIASLIPLGLGIGVAGMLVDSLLGAGAQGRFICPACGVPTERRVHRCGSATRPTGGFTWLDNDGVNAAATSAAALLGWCAWVIWG